MALVWGVEVRAVHAHVEAGLLPVTSHIAAAIDGRRCGAQGSDEKRRGGEEGLMRGAALRDS